MTSLHLYLCDSDGTNSRLHACDSLLHSFKRPPCSVFPTIRSLTCLVGRTGPVSSMWTVSEQTRCGLHGFSMLPRVLLTSNFFFPPSLNTSILPSLSPSLSARSLCKEGIPLVLPGPLGRNVVQQSSVRRACLDIKHQAATSIGLI